MTRLAILVTTYILSFSANAVSDMVADMQKTYSKFTMAFRGKPLPFR